MAPEITALSAEITASSRSALERIVFACAAADVRAAYLAALG
jgi:hypothetical protein